MSSICTGKNFIHNVGQDSFSGEVCVCGGGGGGRGGGGGGGGGAGALMGGGKTRGYKSD